MVTRKSRYGIARKGENLVHSLLPNSKLMVDIDPHLPWDIEWEGIKIDVKTSQYNVNSTGFTFNIAHPYSNKAIYVLVGLAEGKTYFWVIKRIDASSYLAKHKDAIIAEELPEAIKICSQAEEPPLPEFMHAKHRINITLDEKHIAALSSYSKRTGKDRSRIFGEWIAEKLLPNLELTEISVVSDDPNTTPGVYPFEKVTPVITDALPTPQR